MLEFRLRKATHSDAPRQSYVELVFRHTTAAAKGPAMETNKLMYGRSMTDAASDYPLACVAAFYRDWRKSPQGRWWPTESDLIRGCDAHLGIWRDRHTRVYADVLDRGLSPIDSHIDQGDFKDDPTKQIQRGERT